MAQKKTNIRKTSRFKARPRKVKPASAKNLKIRNLCGALDIIQEMLMEKPYSRDLWNVLTALRGPDTPSDSPMFAVDGSHATKLATTSVIRDAAFPKRPTDNLAVYAKDTLTFRDRRLSTYASHFINHAQAAFESLGLNWRAVNPAGTWWTDEKNK